MDGWVDRWKDGWMDGSMDVWMDGWMDGPTDRHCLIFRYPIPSDWDRVSKLMIHLLSYVIYCEHVIHNPRTP